MNNQSALAQQVVEFLQAGNDPWRYPHNKRPEFSKLFGTFFKGPPLADAEVCYSDVDAIIEATGVRILHHWRCTRPHCQRPPKDRIILPLRSYFQDERQYQATRIHEVLHFVEQPHRAGWLGPCADQSELVSECGTGLMESHLRLPHDEDNYNLNKWLPHWVAQINRDPAYLFNAISQAEKAVLYLLDRWRRKTAA